VALASGPVVVALALKVQSLGLRVQVLVLPLPLRFLPWLHHWCNALLILALHAVSVHWTRAKFSVAHLPTPRYSYHGTHKCFMCELEACDSYSIYAHISTTRDAVTLLHYVHLIITNCTTFISRYVNKHIHPSIQSCLQSCYFCRTMRCISTAYAVMRCPSVCLSRSWVVSKRIKVSSKFFHRRAATPI